MDILTREIVSNMFYEYLRESVELIREDTNLQFIKDYEVKGHSDIHVDYAFLGDEKMRPVYLFGIRDTNKAQQTTINCLNMKLKNVPHKSVCVFEDIDDVTGFARNALLDAAGKVYSNLNSFKEDGANYIMQELAG